MIKSWKLDNFKSINKKETLEFRPLTVFAGANSSGKSTVLQSILLISQTLQSQIRSRAVVLNGAIKQFGSYSDIVHCRDLSKEIGIGFTLSVDNPDEYYRFMFDNEDVKLVDLELELASEKQTEEDLSPIVESLKVKSLDGEDKEMFLEINRIPNPQSTPALDSLLEQDLVSLADLKYKVVTNFRKRLGVSNRVETNSIGVVLFHFLPSFLVNSYNKIDSFRGLLSDILMDNFRYSDFSRKDEDLFLNIIKEKVLDVSKMIYDTQGPSLSSSIKSRYANLSKDFSIENLSRFFHAVVLDQNMRKAYYDDIASVLSRRIRQLAS